MKKKRITSVLASIAVFATVAAAVPMNAGAAGTYDSTKITGQLTTTFDKYMVMSKSANVPNATFTYSIAPGAAVPATDTTAAVFAGVGTPQFAASASDDTGSDERGKVIFKSSDSPILESEKRVGDSPVFSTEDDTDEKYVAKMLTIEFPESTPFTMPGIYRYIITESGTAAGVQNDPVAKRTLDVYVDDNEATEANDLMIAGYVMYSGEVTAAPKKELPEGKTAVDVPNGLEAAEKSDSYTNKYTVKTLAFGKEVKGNQGSKDKYFKFTLTVSNAAGATLDVKDSGFSASTIKTSSTIYEKDVMDLANGADDEPTMDGFQITVGATGTATRDFYLRDGEYVKIVGLPKGASYALTEAAEDYVSATGTEKIAVPAVGTEGEAGYVAAITYNSPVSGTIDTQDVYTGFTNTKTGLLPTGILVSVAGPAVVGVIALLGIAVLLIRGKRRKAEEE